MTTQLAARTLTGDSLGFHILFAMLGVGIPLMILLAEFIAIKWGSKEWYADARRWTEVLVVLFVAGAASGTIISLQFSTIWGPLMKILEPATGDAFFLEGIAFFVEAIFLAIYIIVWPKTPSWKHWLTGIPILLGGTASAFFITSVNAFMNAPQGFTLSHGAAIDVDPLKTMFNPATATETSHSIVAYFVASFALFITWYAWRAWRKKSSGEAHVRNRLIILGAACLILLGGTGLTGDSSGKYLAKHEPAKLAAAEGLVHTQSNAPLQIGGILQSDGSLKDAITVPGALSFLATGKFSGVVQGVDATPKQDRPTGFIHYFFDAMVGIGTLMPLILVIFLALVWRKKPAAFSRPMLWGLMLLGLLGILAVEFGWLLTEIGRQPYAIKGVIRVADAYTKSDFAVKFGEIFPTLYLLLFAVTGWALLILRRIQDRPSKESAKRPSVAAKGRV
jgi:cytochrome d ubiquinol oxidase subunit I